MTDAERIAGFVAQAAALQRQFEMAHVLVVVGIFAEPGIAELAPGDALVGQHFGDERLVLRPRRQCMRAQRGDRRKLGGGCGFQQVAGMGQCLLAPRCGDGVDVEVGFTEWLHARCAEFGQSRIQFAGDAAEVRITGVAEAEHRELQLRQFRRAPAEQELGEADRIVRWIAFALGTDDEVEQALVRQFAGGVGIGTQQARGQAGGFECGMQGIRRAARIAGLAAVHDGGGESCGGRHRRDGSRRLQAARQSGQVAGGP